MKLSYLFFLAALALPACASNRVSVEEKKGDVYHSAGLEALRAGRYAEALGAMQEAARYLPKDPAVFNNLGLAYANKGEFNRAEESFRRALQLDARFNDARLNLGALQIRQLRWREAEAVLREATKDLAYVNQHQVYFNLSLIYSEWKRPVLAEQNLKLAVQAAPTFCEAWYRLGRIQKERGSAAEARDSYSHAVSGTCFREYPDAHFEIANLYLQQHDDRRGKAKLIEVIQLFPETEWARKSELTLNNIR